MDTEDGTEDLVLAAVGGLLGGLHSDIMISFIMILMLIYLYFSTSR